MSLKDLLPPGTYDDIVSEANKGSSDSEDGVKSQDTAPDAASGPIVTCPTCKKKLVYSSANPFRPFCSERCKLIDLGAWAEEKRTVAGRQVNEDEDADLLNDPRLPKRNEPML